MTSEDTAVLVTGANRGIQAAAGRVDSLDFLSQSMAESWRGGATKAFERQFSALVAADPPTA